MTSTREPLLSPTSTHTSTVVTPAAYTLADRLFALLALAGDRKAARPARLGVTALEDRAVPDSRPLP